MEQEIWSDIDVNDNYEISSHGRVRTKKTGRVRKISKRGDYLSIALSRDGIKTKYSIHRLVAKAFVDANGDTEKLVVNHKDGDKYNNYYTNLEWVTASRNVIHAFEEGLQSTNSRRVNQFTIDGDFIQSFSSISEAAEETKTCPKKISAVCKGRRHTTNGFCWRYVNDLDEIPFDTDGWLVYEEYDNYLFSRKGEVYSKHSKRLLRPNKRSNGSLVVNLSKDGTCKTISLHRIIAELYCDNPGQCEFVVHIDDDKSNNHFENLKWTTMSEMKTGHESYQNAGVAVKCMDKEGNIRIFRSVKKASDGMKVDSSSIVRVCKGKQKTAGGFVWSYCL